MTIDIYLGDSCSCDEENDQKCKWEIPRMDGMSNGCESRSDKACWSETVVRPASIDHISRQRDSKNGLHRGVWIEGSVAG